MLLSGMRCEAKNKGETFYGVIVRVSNKGGKRIVKMLLDGGGGYLNGSESLFSLSEKPLPETKPCDFKVGDWVSFEDEKEGTIKGVVNKVTFKATVYFVKVFSVNGRFSIKAPASRFTKIDAPVETATPMDKWGVTSYRKCSGHDDSQPFTAKITLDGKVVGSASDDGWGGGGMIDLPSDILKKLEEDVVVWNKTFGGKDFSPSSLIDIWIDWFVNEKTHGVTAKEYLA